MLAFVLMMVLLVSVCLIGASPTRAEQMEETRQRVRNRVRQREQEAYQKEVEQAIDGLPSITW